jgi:hypothetical protein
MWGHFSPPSDSAFSRKIWWKPAHSDVVQPSGHRLIRGIARQACDRCRLRKAKCDTINYPVRSSPDLDQPNHSRSPATQARQCQSCASLGLSYTFSSSIENPRPTEKVCLAWHLISKKPLHQCDRQGCDISKFSVVPPSPNFGPSIFS